MIIGIKSGRKLRFFNMVLYINFVLLLHSRFFILDKQRFLTRKIKH